MELHQLRYFVAVAEEGSVTRAANRLRISQPAVSRQIAALEDELGVRLFEREKRRIVITTAGSFFLSRARRILCDLETAAQQVRERFGSAPEAVRLGCFLPFLDDIVSPAVRALRREMPRVEVSLFELTPQAQLDRLRDGDLDLAILGNLTDDDRARYVVHRLMRSRMAVVVAAEHRLSARKAIDLREVADESFVSLSDAVFPGRRAFLEKACGAAGFKPRVRTECESLSVLASEVATGGGVALLPYHARKLPHSGCVYVMLRRPAVHADVVALTHERQLAGSAGRLLEHLRAAAGRIER